MQDVDIQKFMTEKGLTHVIQCAIFGVAWVVLTWIFGHMGVVGSLLMGILSIPYVIGGLVFCWKDVAPGWQNGLIVGALYGIILVVLKILFEGLIGFGTVPVISTIPGSIGGLDFVGFLGGFGGSWWSGTFGFPGIWPSLLGIIAFGGAFSYIKDYMTGKLNIPFIQDTVKSFDSSMKSFDIGGTPEVKEEFKPTNTEFDKYVNMLPRSMSDSLSSAVKNEVAKMSAQKQQEFIEEYKRKAKSKTVAYILWFFLGWHYAYMGQWGWQFLFWFTGGGFVIWWIVDLFRIPTLVGNYNKDKAMECLRNIKAIS